MKSHVRYRVLLIDDDIEMNRHLFKHLPRQYNFNRISYDVEIDYLDVMIDRQTDPSNERWKIADETLERMYELSSNPGYDLVIADYALPSPNAQRVLFGEDMSKVPDRSQLPGLIFNLEDLKNSFVDFIQNKQLPKRFIRKNIFVSNSKVILRSFASRLYLNLVGYMETRIEITKRAFPHAEIIPIDTRKCFYNWDEFYNIYDLKRPFNYDDYNIHYKRDDAEHFGRSHYRHLVFSFLNEKLFSQILEHYSKRNGKLRMTRTKKNVAIYSGIIASIGGLSQFFAYAAGSFSQNEPIHTLLPLIIGTLTVLLGAFLFPLLFESILSSTVEFEKDE